jgi:hypothetical protein
MSLQQQRNIYKYMAFSSMSTPECSYFKFCLWNPIFNSVNPATKISTTICGTPSEANDTENHWKINYQKSQQGGKVEEKTEG